LGIGRELLGVDRPITDNHEIHRIRYFGDIDLSGLSIPFSAKRTAHSNKLPDVLPASHLYAELFAAGRSWQAGDKAVDEERARKLADWLPAEHQGTAMRLLVEGRRMAQEWVGYQHLMRNRSWEADLI
jgi:hypothetical protein